MANGELDRCVRAEHPAMDCFGIPAKQCTIGVSDGHIVEPPVFSARDVAFRNGSGQDMNKHFVHFPTCHRAAKVLQCGRMLSVQIDARIICKHQFMHGFHAHLVTDSSRAAPGDSFAKSADISSCKQTVRNISSRIAPGPATVPTADVYLDRVKTSKQKACMRLNSKALKKVKLRFAHCSMQ